MRRLVPFLIAAIMASFPPSLLLVFIGGLVSTATYGPTTTSWCHQNSNYCRDDNIIIGGYSSSIGMSTGSDIRSSGGSISSSKSGGFVTGVAAASHTVYVSPSHYPMVATTATIVASTIGGSGGKKKRVGGIQSVDAETMVPIILHDEVDDFDSSSGSSSCGGGSNSNCGEELVSEGDGTIKVSVLGMSKGKSPSCSHSLVEFTNTHQTDSIVVYSTFIEPSAVFPEKWAAANQGTFNDVPIPPSAPSFHGDYEKDRQLHIPPKTTVTLPVSIIPQWRKPPDLEFDQYHGNRHYRRLDGTEDPGSTSSESSNNIGQDDPGAAFLSSSGNGADEINNSTIHSVLRADLLDMIASSTTHTGVHFSTTSTDDRAELLDSATIIETLVVNTSYGIIQMKMPYVCSPDTKEYEFGLPNNLMFIDSGGGWYARRNTTPTVELAYMFGTWEFNPTRDIHNPFIYNVYMNNPSNSELHIWEVYTTKPHIVGAEIQKHFATSARTPSLGPSVGNNDYLFREGSTIHQPNKNNIYVTTLQLYPSNFTRDMSMTNQDLGFLIIKSNLGSFSIALDYIPDTRRGWEKFARQERANNNSTFIHWAGSNQASLGHGGLVQDSVMDGLLSSLAVDLEKPTPLKMMSITKSYRVQDLQSKNEGWEGQKYLQKQQKNTNDAADSQQLNSTLSLIKATPPYINFGSITTASRIRIPIQLKNYHSKPLRVMRISIAMSLVSDNGHGKITDISNETSGMEIGVEFYDGTVPTPLSDRNESSSSSTQTSEAFIFSQEMVLPPDNPNMFDFFHPIYVWCRFNTNISSAEDIEARFYTGSILIHATEGGTDVPYQEWERQLILDHSTSASSTEISEHYLLQIPFTGSVLPGHLGGPSESPLFPTYFNILPVEERMKIMKDQSTSIGSDVPTYYDRILDISNNFDAAISILDMKIMDLIPSSNDDFCSNRFTLDPMVGKGGLVPLTAQSGKRWNGLIIRYHFMNKTDHLDVGVKKCILSLDTDLAGKQLLPLIVYSGEVIVDVERPSDSSENAGQPPQLAEIGCMVTQENGETVISSSGMPCMKDWLLNTKEGIVLGKALEEWHTTLTSPFRSHRKCEKAIISSSSDDCSHLNAPVDYYLRSLLSNPSEGSDIVLKPIVVPFGAIRTGEALSRSVLLTNHNYAPMEIMATSAALGNMNITMDVVSDSAFDSLGRMSFPAGEEDMSYFC